MTKRMLIDSTHAEETRVVVLDGNRLEDYDVETSTKQQLKGNIYLAKIVRVEPSLQAAFVEFGGGRHGFLAFGEIHPDYYQIPVADRKRLLEMQEAEAREEEEEEEREALRRERGGGRRAAPAEAPGTDDEGDAPAEPAEADALTEAAYATQADPDDADAALPGDPAEHADEPSALPHDDHAAQPASIAQDILVAPEEALHEAPLSEPPSSEAAIPEGVDLAPEAAELAESDAGLEAAEAPEATESGLDALPPPEPPEQIGGEHETDDRPDRRPTPRFMRNYKIQEVMRRRQILLVQVVKEERGTKGAALTTYISLAGRFSVLMPNSPRGGGISRKITSAADRRRLKEITAELDLPRGMGLIVRTAGAARPKAEIIRDCEYLLTQWDQIRDLTMKSMAPALIYEEASLIKRAIRDVYSRDVDEILVDGDDGWRAARDFMRMLMPAHAKKVQLWRDPQPLFAKAQVESQLDSMLQPTVQLRSGGYLVINQTEALVAIDVNSGRSTRERGIEETAVRTNLEAAEEAARQLRLRDLAGLIVIDFIDMESRRNNAAVEKKLKDALKNDRARIQVGSISHFGLLEMSRQRLRPSLAETSFVPCPHCGGTGQMRSTESAALAVLRGIEDEGAKRRSAEILVHVHGSIALYVLNHKRVRLAEIEQRFGMHVTFHADESLIPPQMRIEKLRALLPSEVPVPIAAPAPADPVEDPDDAVMEADDIETDVPAADEDEDEAERPGETAEDGEQRQRGKRRRRRRGGRRDDAPAAPADGEAAEPAIAASEDPEAEQSSELPATEAQPDGPADGAVEAAPPADDAQAEGERKRRGRRGGRRRRREPGEGAPAAETADNAAAEQHEQPAQSYTPPPYTPPAYSPPAYTPVPTYVGPTPANPFGGDSNAYAFFDAVEEIDEPVRRPPSPLAASIPAPALPDPAPAVADEIAAVAPPPEPPIEPEIEPPPAEMPAPGPTVGAAVEPILVGTPDAPAEKKRGWWRR